MNYWLIKSEPTEYSWQQFLKDGRMYWYGIRNYAARNNLKDMKVGDLCFFYHSNEGKEIVGIAKVVKEFYQDPTTKDERWVVVDVVPEKELKKSVTLEAIKANPKLKDMQLVRISRLSVSKVNAEEWAEIISMSKN